MKQSLSIKMLKMAGVCLVLAGLWLGIAWLIAKDVDTAGKIWALRSVNVGCMTILGALSLMFFGKWAMRPKWYLAPFLWGLIGVILFYWSQHCITAVHPFLTHGLTTDVGKDMLWMYAWNGGVGIFIALFPVIFIFHKDRLRENKYWRQWFIEGEGAGCDFGGIASFSRMGVKLFSWFSKQGIITKHIVIGRALWMDDPRMTMIADKQNSHNIVCASARSGKSISVAYNVLLTYENPTIVFDPRGEHARQTLYRRCSKEFLETHGLEGKATKHFEGGEGYVLDPFKETSIPSCSYNPLSEISLNDPRIREKISAISDGCVSPENGDNKHFEEFSKYLIEGAIAYALGNFARQNQNLVFIYDTLNGIDREIGVARTERFNEFLVRMLMDTESAGGLPAEAAMRLKDMGDRERGSVLSTTARSLKWISDPSMRKHLMGKSDFKFSEIGTIQGVTQTVYIVLPEGLMSESGQMRWFRVLTNLGIVLLRNRPNFDQLPTTLFVLDEFARLGKIQMISEGISTLMGDKIKLFIALQNLGQLKQDYPERWNSFIANSTLQFFGVHDLETAGFVSEMLGNRTVKYKNKKTGQVSKEVVPLMTPQEVMVFLSKKKNRQIVFPVEGLPLRLERVAYKKIKGFNAIGGLRGHYEF